MNVQIKPIQRVEIHFKDNEQDSKKVADLVSTLGIISQPFIGPCAERAAEGYNQKRIMYTLLDPLQCTVLKEDLATITEYLEDEQEEYDKYVKDGGDPEDHIWTVIKRLKGNL